MNVDDLAEVDWARAFVRDNHLSLPGAAVALRTIAGIYNILYRYLFDRHRDLTLPTSFLITSVGDIVKVYQGPVESGAREQDFQQIPKLPPRDWLRHCHSPV